MPTPAVRTAWFNGAFVPETNVQVPYRDRSFKYGDGVFDMTRTFGGRIFKLREHLDRLYQSLKYAGIDSGLSADEMMEITEELPEAVPLVTLPGSLRARAWRSRDNA